MSKSTKKQLDKLVLTTAKLVLATKMIELLKPILKCLTT